MMRAILNLFFGRRMATQTAEYLNRLSSAAVTSSRTDVHQALSRVHSKAGPTVLLGQTEWKEPVRVPLAALTAAHSLITGGTGSGKTRFALAIIDALITQQSASGFCVVDPKGELFLGTLALLAQHLAQVRAMSQDAADALRNRIVILDFAARDAISPFSLTCRDNSVDLGHFAESRAELLLDLLPGGDGISLAGTAVLRRCLMLLSAAALPATLVPTVLNDDALRRRLLTTHADDETREYFRIQFPKIPLQTVAALSRRMDALFASEAVRLSLSGPTAPNFRLLQDDGYIVLVNCFGENLSRTVRQLLQSLVLSDMAQSVFSRKRRERLFTIFCDEAQVLFANDRTREHMNEILTMSRSFGSFLCCLTQNISTAVNDTRMLHTLHTNIGWSFSMRGDPNDASFLKAALPITGQKVQPRSNPLESPRVYSPNDERTNELNAIAHLPDRVGFLWLKKHAAEAIRIRTATVALPPDSLAFELLRDPSVGSRLSREQHSASLATLRSVVEADPEPGLSSSLVHSYRRRREGPG